MKTLLIIFIAAVVFSWLCTKLLIYTWNRKWRKNISVGDQCYFINIRGKKSEGKVEAISNDRKMARVKIKAGLGYSIGWHDVETLKVV